LVILGVIFPHIEGFYALSMSYFLARWYLVALLRL
jgi:hypothetical protein